MPTEPVTHLLDRIGHRRGLCDDLPRIGGTLKDRPEDFVVEELPAYTPSGEGEHLFLWVEKRNESAQHLVKQLARTLGVSKHDIGTAGLKDKLAVTRQWVSVPATCEPRLKQAESDAVRILEAVRHGNKLKTGHLRGNRFEIVVRNVADDALERATAVADRLRERGLPNYFGDQRFGRNAETLLLGFDLLTGEKSQRDLSRHERRFLLRLALSAAQSGLFNELLERRLAAGRLHEIAVGDVMQVVGSGGRFVVEETERERPRFDAREIVPTGPMYGPKMTRPTGDPAAVEDALLTEFGLSLDDFARFGKLALGTRRPYLVFAGDLTVQPVDETTLRFRFELPSGSYATELLREFLRDSTS